MKKIVTCQHRPTRMSRVIGDDQLTTHTNYQPHEIGVITWPYGLAVILNSFTILSSSHYK